MLFVFHILKKYFRNGCWFDGTDPDAGQSRKSVEKIYYLHKSPFSGFISSHVHTGNHNFANAFFNQHRGFFLQIREFTVTGTTSCKWYDTKRAHEITAVLYF